LVDLFGAQNSSVHAWVVLPNHYHVLAHVPDVLALLRELGRLHGRSSHDWNGEENRRGRQVWCKAAETFIKSDRHFWAALNYVHHNPVRHEYVERWQDWPFSSAAEYLSAMGRAKAEAIWQQYPVLDFGQDWDPPGL
jgi:putative transposase